MKKRLISVIFCTAAALLLAACSRAEGVLREKTEIPNPVAECAAMEQAKALTGFDMTAPEAVEGYTERAISVIQDDLVQIRFTDGQRELLLRKCRGSGDCSGDYNTYSQTISTQAGGVTMKGDDDRVKLAVWTAGEYAYSVGVYGGEGMTAEEMTELIAQIQ